MLKVFMTEAGDFVSSLKSFSSFTVPIWADTADSSFVSFFSKIGFPDNKPRHGDF
jgi:hypothetical protein